MNRRVIFASSARDDLRNIRVHLDSYDEMNFTEIAQRTVSDLVTKIYNLAEKGVAGSRRSFIPEHVRAFPYKQYCFYFTIEGDTLTLLRVLGQRQDVENITFDPSRNEDH